MNLVFIGPPGAGKGTVAKVLEHDMGIVQISTGALLREATRNNTELGHQAAVYMNAGNLVPDDLVITLIKERITEPDCKNGFALDGFPRTLPQARALMGDGVKIDLVINFNIDDATIIHRLSGRRIHRETGEVYNVNPNGRPKPPPDLSPGLIILRDDDKPESITNRLVVYHKQTEPLIAFYRKKGLLLELDGTNDVEPLLEEIKARLAC